MIVFVVQIDDLPSRRFDSFSVKRHITNTLPKGPLRNSRLAARSPTGLLSGMLRSAGIEAAGLVAKVD
ncbi:MAG: hypothetical protein F4114_02985 [Rhodospirillaceae bacterium]|nr:hypothetical protein [Rhodospirillaceae bacterium]MYB14882.1 hypothetical protein [Rhodospirillaceae bacterium]MYI48039.1 hypothetical protein [Rhodospirillaceae bacterium]